MSTFSYLIGKYIHYILIGMVVFIILMVAELPFSFYLPFHADLPEWMQEQSLVSLIVPVFPFVLLAGVMLGTVIFLGKEL